MLLYIVTSVTFVFINAIALSPLTHTPTMRVIKWVQ